MPELTTNGVRGLTVAPLSRVNGLRPNWLVDKPTPTAPAVPGAGATAGGGPAVTGGGVAAPPWLPPEVVVPDAVGPGRPITIAAPTPGDPVDWPPPTAAATLAAKAALSVFSAESNRFASVSRVDAEAAGSAAEKVSEGGWVEPVPPVEPPWVEPVPPVEPPPPPSPWEDVPEVEPSPGTMP
jgi:hypothetical protein